MAMQLTSEQAQFLGGILLGGIRHELETTKKVLAAAPADRLDFKLGDKGRTLRELMHHLVESEIWFADFLLTGQMGQEAPMAPDMTKDQILARYANDLPPAIDRVAALSGEQFARQLDFFGAFNYPAAFYLNFWSAHSIHHRGQLSTYLRALDAHVPSIYGGSADEPFQMPASA
jgi:uncharacterized damage-inducible protein DinB